jgi:hypothetical protein
MFGPRCIGIPIALVLVMRPMAATGAPVAQTNQAFRVLPSMSVSQVLARAKPGAVVLIEGEHHESLSVPGGVLLRGAAGAAIISHGAPAVVVRGGWDVAIEGLRIVSYGSDAVVVDGGQVRLRGCKLTGERGLLISEKCVEPSVAARCEFLYSKVGVQVVNPTTTHRVEDSWFENNTVAGVYETAAKATVPIRTYPEESYVASPKLGTRTSIEHCTFVLNKLGVGLAYQGHVRVKAGNHLDLASIANCVFQDNARDIFVHITRDDALPANPATNRNWLNAEINQIATSDNATRQTPRLEFKVFDEKVATKSVDLDNFEPTGPIKVWSPTDLDFLNGLIFWGIGIPLAILSAPTGVGIVVAFAVPWSILVVVSAPFRFLDGLANAKVLPIRTSSEVVLKDGVSTKLKHNPISAWLPRPGWSGPAKLEPLELFPPSLACSLIAPSPALQLAADDGEDVTVKIENTGVTMAADVHLEVKQASDVPGLHVPARVEAGDIPPGSSKEVRLSVSSSWNVVQGATSLSVTAADGFQTRSPAIEIPLTTRTLVPPALKLASRSIEAPDGGTRVRRGSPFLLKCTVQNQGQGLARGVATSLSAGASTIIVAPVGEPETFDLAPGASRTLNYRVLIQNRYDGASEVPLTLHVKEKRPHLGLDAPVTVTLSGGGGPTVERIAERLPDTAAAPETHEALGPAPKAARPRPAGHAVIIGLERYGSAPVCRFARRDAGAVRERVVTTLGVPEENVVTLTDEQATLGNIRTALEGQLGNAVDRGESDIYVYFAGHALPSANTGKVFLVPFDGNPAYPETSCYSLSELLQAVSHLGGRSATVVLDTSFNGEAARTRPAQPLLANARPVRLEGRLDSPPANVLLLTATSEDGPCLVSERAQMGLFTLSFLRGLGGPADADRDGRTSHAELWKFVETSVEKLAPGQAPRMVGSTDARGLE